jgi:ribonuclease BN (tRNA processing enzyme)
VYGGETTCIVVETADGNVIVLDGGSGIRNASKHMIRNWGDRPRSIDILATHEHLDHRSGLPFCQFCFSRPPFDIRIHGTRQFLVALDVRYAIYSHHITPQTYYDDPIDYRVMSANFSGFEIPGENDGPPAQHWGRHPAGQTIRIGATEVTPFDVYHGPTRCLAYKIKHGDATFVFCTDHELRHGGEAADPKRLRSLAAEARLRAHCADADLAYFDGQYFLDEYHGKRGIGLSAAVPRIDWGHGCIEDAIERSRECRIRHTLIGHHDPERMWQERLSLDQKLLAEHGPESPQRIELAKSDMVIDL